MSEIAFGCAVTLEGGGEKRAELEAKRDTIVLYYNLMKMQRTEGETPHIEEHSGLSGVIMS